jgi:hypothetical protein
MKVSDVVAPYVAHKRSLGMRFNAEARTLKSFCCYVSCWNPGAFGIDPTEVLPLSSPAATQASLPRRLTVEQLLSGLETLLSSQPANNAVLLIELSDAFRLQDSLGYEARTGSFERFAVAVETTLAPRATVNRLGDFSLCVGLQLRPRSTGGGVRSSRRRGMLRGCFTSAAAAANGYRSAP